MAVHLTVQHHYVAVGAAVVANLDSGDRLPPRPLYNHILYNAQARDVCWNFSTFHPSHVNSISTM